MKFDLPTADSGLPLSDADQIVKQLSEYPGTADVHIYSILSRGSQGLFQLCRSARNAGLDHICIMDREQLLTAPLAAEFSLMTDIDVIPGGELTCRHTLGGKCVTVQVGFLWPPDEEADFLAFFEQKDPAAPLPDLSRVLEVIRRSNAAAETRACAVLHVPFTCAPDRAERETLIADFRALGGVGLEVWSPGLTPSQTEELLDCCARVGLLPTGGSGHCRSADGFLPMEEGAFQALQAYHLREDAVDRPVRQEEDGSCSIELTAELAEALEKCPFCVPGYWGKQRRWGLLYLPREEYEQWLVTVMARIEQATAPYTQKIFRRVLHSSSLIGNTLRIPDFPAHFAKLDGGTGRFFRPYPGPVLFLTGTEPF